VGLVATFGRRASPTSAFGALERAVTAETALSQVRDTSCAKHTTKSSV
jgi:hypothetical protein